MKGEQYRFVYPDDDDEDYEKDPDNKNSTTMKRTKKPAGIKHIKDIVAEDHTEKIQPYHDTSWRKLF